MKILSVSREYTESEDEIAFNLDDVISAELMALVEYGRLKLIPRGDVLVVRKEKGEEAFDPDFVATLQGKLDAAEEALRMAAHKRLHFQAAIARRLLLPLN